MSSPEIKNTETNPNAEPHDIPNGDDLETVIVKSWNKLYSTDDKTKDTLGELRMLMLQFVATGHEELLTTGIKMKPFDEMIWHITEELNKDPSIFDRLCLEYGNGVKPHIETVVRDLGSEAFRGFANNIGSIDALYKLAPSDPAGYNESVLTVVGFGSTIPNGFQR